MGRVAASVEREASAKAELHVSCDVCEAGCRFTSVQAAINAAPDGGTVRIAAGTYAGAVTIDTDITIVRCGGGRVILTIPRTNSGPWSKSCRA